MRRLLKLVKMSPAEVGTRCGALMRREAERRAWKRQETTPRDVACGGASGTSAERVLLAAAAMVPGTTWAELARLREERPDLVLEAVRRASDTAENVLSGKLTLLGHVFDLRDKINWHADPRSSYRWDRAFYADLPLYRGLPDEVDVKYVWELGRHQYLAETARAWLLTGERRYAERVREIMLDWIEENPLYEGIHWTSALEVAMRAISWIWSLAALSDWDGWDTADLDRVATALAEHAVYLERHFSFYESPYNHLIGEAAGLYLLGRLLDEHPDASRWRRRGRRVLEQHGTRQFYPDGFCVEQATGYHFYTLGFLSLAVAAARAGGEPIVSLEETVRRAYRAAVPFRRPDGLWPALGDVDSARSIPVGHPEFWNFDSLCGLGAALFEDGDLKTDPDSPGEETFWLLGMNGIRRWESLAVGKPPRHAVLRESGYVIAADRGDWLLFDAGPVAAGLHRGGTPSAAHGHADVFQILYASGGVPVLIDPGMPFYGGPCEWVEYFRSAAAHNTVDVEGVGPVRPAGHLAWSLAEKPPACEARLSDDVWLASAVAHWRPDVRVERQLLAVPGAGLWVADIVTSARPRRVTANWQLAEPFAPGPVSEADGGTAVSCGSLTLAVWSEAAVGVEIVEPANTSPAGWEWPGYGVKRPAAGVRIGLPREIRHLCLTFIGETPFPVEVAISNRQLAAGGTPEPEVATFLVAGAVWRIPSRVLGRRQVSSGRPEAVTGSGRR